MQLDDISEFHKIDSQNMLGEIDALPAQLAKAYSDSFLYNLDRLKKPDIVLIAGMGGSAIGGDLLSAYCVPLCSVPIVNWREYSLPAWAASHNTLVIASSHSGNTEETLSIFNEAIKVNLPMLVITTGGEIAKSAQANQVPLWLFEHQGQPRAAVGYSFGILLALCERLGLIPPQRQLVEEAVAEVEKKQEHYTTDVPIIKNPVKRLAGQALGRQVAVFASDHLAPVARRWKTQINELAKAWAQFEVLPEADHNTLAGIEKDENILTKIMAVFLKGGHAHPRNNLRANLTSAELLAAGIGVDSLEFNGISRLAEMWDALLFGDYFAYYLALAYDIDPTPVETLTNLKHNMKR